MADDPWVTLPPGSRQAPFGSVVTAIMRFTRWSLLLCCVASCGCAVAPGGPGDGSITHDIADYFHREWPLAGPEAFSTNHAACDGDDSRRRACQSEPSEQRVWSDDWDQPGCLPHTMGYTDDPPPAVPLDAGPRGRFFPAPVQPVFSPQGPSVVGFGTNAKAAG